MLRGVQKEGKKRKWRKKRGTRAVRIDRIRPTRYGDAGRSGVGGKNTEGGKESQKTEKKYAVGGMTCGADEKVRGAINLEKKVRLVEVGNRCGRPCMVPTSYTKKRVGKKSRRESPKRRTSKRRCCHQLVELMQAENDEQKKDEGYPKT